MLDSATTVTAIVKQQATRRGDAAALRGPGGRVLTYRDLASQADAVAAGLTALGVGRADRILIPAANTPDAVVALLAAISAGVAVPVNPAVGELELSAIRAKIAPAAVLLAGVDGPLWENSMPHDRVLRHDQITQSGGTPATAPQPDDLAVLIGTSGNVTEPRFVALTHDQWIDGARRVVDYFGIGPDDRVLNLMPLFHNHGLNGTVLTTLLAGGQVYCPGVLDHARLPEWLAEIAPTWVTGAPTVLSALLDAVTWASDLRRAMKLRFVRSASAHLPPTLRTELADKLGVPVVEIWGLTEAGGQVTAPPVPKDGNTPQEADGQASPATADSQAAGDVGVASHGFEIAVLDEHDRPALPGLPGEVVVRGGLPSSGYFRDEEATAELFQGGWLHTSDIGVLDAEGHLHIRGRMSDYANRGGEKVWLPQIDTACAAYPGVRDAMAFPVPHPRLGQDVAVAVVTEPGTDLDVAAMRNFLRGRLSAGLIPRRVEIITALPLGPTGKAVRRMLSESLGGRDAGGAAPTDAPPRRSGRSPAEVVLAALWCEVLGIDSIGDDEDFLAAGGDSILATRLVANVYEALGADLPLEIVLSEGSTVAAMARAVAERKAANPA